MIPLGIISGRPLLNPSGGGFPFLLSVTPSQTNTSETSHSVQMPSAVDAGDLLVCLVTAGPATAQSISAPEGWSKVATNASNTVAISAIFTKIASGMEGGGAAVFTTTTARRAVGVLLRFQAGTFSGDVEFAAAATTSLNTVAPALSPSWGSRMCSVIFYAGTGRNRTVSSWPLPENQIRVSNEVDATSAVSGYLCTDEIEASTFAPNNLVFNSGTGPSGYCYTIAVRPPS